MSRLSSALHSTLSDYLPPSVPIFHASKTLGNHDIIDYLSYPYDPSAPQTLEFGWDWERNRLPPPPVYVVATPDEYELSTNRLDTQELLIQGVIEMVRLKEAVAREHGLQVEWTSVSTARGVADGYPKRTLEFTQWWALRHCCIPQMTFESRTFGQSEFLHKSASG